LLLADCGVELPAATVEVDEAEFGDTLALGARTDTEVLLALAVGVVDAPETGTDDPLISACTVVLNVPVIPERLYVGVNSKLEPGKWQYSREVGRERLSIGTGFIRICQAYRSELDEANK
jgi:hypothetical protein